MEHFFIQDIVLVKRASEAREIKHCNQMSRRYGLALSELQIEALIEEHALALKHTDRIEFGSGILKDLIEVFCASPYILPDDYESTLAELQGMFYQCKNDSREEISDEELLETMRTLFDETAHGSLDYLEELLMQRFRLDAHPVPLNEEVDIYVSVQDEERTSDDADALACYGDDWLDDIGARGWDGEVWVDDEQ
jgi:hypothetical protein